MNSHVRFSGATALDAEVAAGVVRPLTIIRIAAPSAAFAIGKRCFDILAAALLLPFVIATALVLLVLNPFLNPGPLLFRQVRMGRDCQPFVAYKFRTMRVCEGAERGPFDPLERDRITPLGLFLRQTHIDELPQFFNVLLGEMSVVGPRPDYWDHAVHYAESIPGYRERHIVTPGITGLAQVDAGYAESAGATFRKVRYDLRYIRRACVTTELYVLWRTVQIVLTGAGTR